MDTRKDCDCITHAGPHWLHMDAMWKERNSAMLSQLVIAINERRFWDATVIQKSYIENEQRRLDEKLKNLIRAGATDQESIVVERPPLKKQRRAARQHSTSGPMVCCGHPLLDNDCMWPGCELYVAR